jgi:DeoR family fructose operon transcriptional repressor
MKEGYELSKKPDENMFAEERKHMIVDIINREVKTTVAELCERFSVSPATIRNDLRELEFAGLLKRTHGGAISNRKASFELNSYQKEVENIDKKTAIGRAAAQYVQDGDVIAVDTGTTMFEFVKAIAADKNIKVVTNDLQIAVYLERFSDIDTILAGGMVRRNFHSTVGPVAVEAIKGFNVDRSFMAANGVHPARGITAPNIDQAQVKEALVAAADEVILLADSSKLGKASFVKFAELAQVDLLITDSGISAETLSELEQMGINVEVARV